MDLKAAARTLCDFGRKLVREGLVARTWGNLSIRLDEDYCLITPSGRRYEELSPLEMVKLKIDDLSYQGKIKPSSEKDLHARLYLMHPAIGAVIHTHQPQASSIAAARVDLPIIRKENRKLLGAMVPCAAYALPTSRALLKAVIKLYLKSDYNAILLANHGALCLGSHLDEAFIVAKTLEQSARDFIYKHFLQMSTSKKADPDELIHYYLAYQSKGKFHG